MVGGIRLVFFHEVPDCPADFLVRHDELEAAHSIGNPGDLGINIQDFIFLNLKIELENFGRGVHIAYFQADTAFTDVMGFHHDRVSLDLKNVPGF